MSSEYCEAQLDSELLIKEVKSNPCLYARNDPRYNDVNYKRIVWDKITKVLFSKVWPKCDDEEKADKMEAVQKRWKNLRACFARELKRQRDPKWIYGVAYKRRKYLYFNSLSFLKSECENGEEDVTHDIDLPEQTETDIATVTVDTNFEEITIPDPLPKSKIETYGRKKSVKDENKTKPASNTDTQTKAGDSDSTNFALSLVPMLNMIPIDERVAAQIEILSVLQPFIQKRGDEDKKLKSYDGRRKRKYTSREKYGKKKKEDVSVVSIEIKSEAESDGE